MASAEFDEEALEKRPTVQVGDPFLEKLLLEACLEAMRSGAVAGIQDMGAAGLTCSTCEMAARADTGIEVDLSMVPQRETGMTAYEMLLSESQERMLIVAHKGREREVADIFRKWDLDAVVIGEVRDDGRMRVTHNGEIVCDVPVKALTDEAPVYERPLKAGSAFTGSAGVSPAGVNEEDVSFSSKGASSESSLRADALDAGETPALPANTAPVNLLAAKTDPTLTEEPAASVGGGTDVVSPAPPTAPNLDAAPNHNDALLRLLASPNLASKEWVYRQYDHMVRTNTAVLPGADAAVVRIKETRRALAIALDGNGRYCAANPREGAKLVVAEAARNVVCVGAQPIAITNCLNFASPEKAEVMWAFSEVVDGISEACRAFNTPVVSGNVSFYNETEGRGVLPTPVIGMLGLGDEVKRVIQPGFKNFGDFIALLGTTREDLSLSQYAASVRSPTVREGAKANVIEGTLPDGRVSAGRVPVLDLEAEASVQRACLRAAENGLLR